MQLTYDDFLMLHKKELLQVARYSSLVDSYWSLVTCSWLPVKLTSNQ
jgi:hypothetical protein